MRHKDTREAICDVQNDETILAAVLEAALAISILTLGIGYLHHFSIVEVKRMERGDEVLCLHTVGTYILNSRSAHFSWDETEIFHAIISMADTPSYHIIDGLTRTTFDEDIIAFFMHFLPHYARAKHYSVIITYRKEITATAYNKQLAILTSLGNIRIAREMSWYVKCIRNKHIDDYYCIAAAPNTAAPAPSRLETRN